MTGYNLRNLRAPVMRGFVLKVVAWLLYRLGGWFGIRRHLLRDSNLHILRSVPPEVAALIPTYLPVVPPNIDDYVPIKEALESVSGWNESNGASCRAFTDAYSRQRLTPAQVRTFNRD